MPSSTSLAVVDISRDTAVDRLDPVRVRARIKIRVKVRGRVRTLTCLRLPPGIHDRAPSPAHHLLRRRKSEGQCTH